MPRYDRSPPPGPPPERDNWYKKWARRHPGKTLEQIAGGLTATEREGLLDALKHPQRLTDNRVPFIFRMSHGPLVRRGRQVAEFLRDRA